MTTATSTLPEAMVRAAAAAIANERGGRRGMPPIVNVLDVLPKKLCDEVTEDARAVLEAIGAAELLESLEEAIQTCAFMDQATDDERLTDGDCLNRWKAAIAKARGGR